jgi:hypothetical protein
MKDDDTDLEPAVSGKHDEITKQIIGIFFEVYNELGFGFSNLYTASQCESL